MKPVAVLSAAAVLFSLLLPIFWVRKTPEAPPVSRTDAQTTLSIRTQNGVEQSTLAEHLPGVLAGEMPALFEKEALKAQAVAARTFILYRMAHHSDRHPGEDICDDPNCCKAFLSTEDMKGKWGDQFEAYYEKMQTAVSETDGQYLRYGGAPIQAVFHSSSAGKTLASSDLWNDCPYLLSVDSPETAADVPDYVTQVIVTPEEFQNVCREAYPDMVFPDDPAQWLGTPTLNASGRVETSTVCGTSIPGSQMRTLFSLRSSAYTLEYTAAGTFQFTVTGYGHGVGMSQYGANVYAKNGYGYADILAHYYPGTELVSE
jgi:stage II sporulation protein D